MAGDTPLHLLGPLHTWNVDDPGAPICVDELHQRMIQPEPGGFTTVEIAEDGSIPDGLTVKFELDGLRSVRFSPDSLHYAYLYNRKRVGCAEILQPSREHIQLTFKWSRADFEVLDFFWLPAHPQQSEFADIAIVTTSGIEMFRVLFEQHSAKSLKAIPATVRLSWIDPTSGMILVSTGPRTLQPFDLRLKAPKLARFDLVLKGNQVIEAGDVAVMTIYDAVYCIHADSTSGRVSLRNISNPLQGTPEHDIVIDVKEGEEPSGTLRLSKVDNLLVVHCIDKMVSMIYDIRHRDRLMVPSICGPLALASDSEADEDRSWTGWDCLSGSIVMDRSAGRLYCLKADMVAVLRDFVARSEPDLATVMRFLLRRSDCREHMVRALAKGLDDKLSFDDWSKAFAVLNQAYRQTIEVVSQRTLPIQGRQATATVALQELESVISHQSILSEKDMVAKVFYPYFLSATSAADDSSQGNSGSAGVQAPATREEWQIPLPPCPNLANDDEGCSKPLRSPYMLSVMMSYLRSLLSMHILPHKILQCFVFDVCMYFQQEHVLQQMLHYHVLLDTPELVMRLKEVASAWGSEWATQACMDMALRIQEFSVVADMLLHTKQYLDIVPFLISQNDSSFRLCRLLETLQADIETQAQDPDLLEHVLSEIRTWHAESGKYSDQLVAPNLEGCEQWISDSG